MAPSESGMTLMSLPADIKIEIVKHLPWKDVLDVRRIKCLAWATREKCIWVNLVNEHIASELVPPRLERHMDNYTASELERTFLRWKGAELAWKTADKHPTSERQFRCGIPQLTHLVKGGRWYLTTADKTAAVTYYDLDAKKIRGFKLIPPQARCCRSYYKCLQVCLEVDTTSSNLEFTMAFSIFDIGKEFKREGPNYVYRAIHVWRVRCILNASGRATGLAATKIATIPHQPTFYLVHAMSLSGPSLGLVVHDSRENEMFIVVMNWESAQRQHPYPMRIIGLGDPSTRIQLLPNSRLLCQKGDYFFLYCYSAFQETTELATHRIDDRAVPTWAVKGPGDQPDIPPAIICVAGTTRALFTGPRSLYSLFFHDDSHKLPELVEVTTGPEWRQLWNRFHISLGFQRTLLFSEETKAFSLITHTSGSTIHGQLIVKPFSVYRYPSIALPQFNTFSMDDETGRTVIHAQFSEKAVIIDFSKYV